MAKRHMVIANGKNGRKNRGDARMKKKFHELVEYLDYDELQKIRHDLTMGGVYLARLVEDQIREESKKHESSCTICNTRIDGQSLSNFTLIFGPDDFRKKATFCALDCMEHFLENLKDMRVASDDPHYNPAPALGKHGSCGHA